MIDLIREMLANPKSQADAYSAEFMNGDDIAAFGIRESAVAADVAALKARLRQIATSKGITLPGTA